MAGTPLVSVPYMGNRIWVGPLFTVPIITAKTKVRSSESGDRRDRLFHQLSPPLGSGGALCRWVGSSWSSFARTCHYITRSVGEFVGKINIIGVQTRPEFLLVFEGHCLQGADECTRADFPEHMGPIDNALLERRSHQFSGLLNCKPGAELSISHVTLRVERVIGAMDKLSAILIGKAPQPMHGLAVLAFREPLTQALGLSATTREEPFFALLDLVTLHCAMMTLRKSFHFGDVLRSGIVYIS